MALAKNSAHAISAIHLVSKLLEIDIGIDRSPTSLRPDGETFAIEVVYTRWRLFSPTFTSVVTRLLVRLDDPENSSLQARPAECSAVATFGENTARDLADADYLRELRDRLPALDATYEKPSSSTLANSATVHSPSWMRKANESETFPD